MINLIKNELIKIFSKKSLYIILLILFVIIFFQSAPQNSEEELSELEETIESYSMQKHNIDTSTYSGLTEYIELDTRCDILQYISNKYGNKSWQGYLILDNYNYDAFNMYYDYFLILNQKEENSNNTSYQIEITLDESEAKENYSAIEKIFDSDNWETFAEYQISKFAEQKSEYPSTQVDNIEELNIKTEGLQLRIQNNIPFGYNYLNDAIEEYTRCKTSLYYLNQINDKKYYQKFDKQEAIENLEKAKYIIENKQDIVGNTNQSRNNIANTFESQQLLIVILIIYFSATIVSEEFNTGTIKQLLIRPKSRMEVLMSKFLTLLITTIFSAAIILVMSFVANIILKGTSSLTVPMAIYNFNTDNLMIMGLSKYLLIQFLAKLPLFLGICIISFSLSTILENSVIAALVPLGIYIYGIIYSINISQAIENFSAKFILLSSNWDLKNVLFGKLSDINQIFTLSFQLLICSLYYIVLLLLTFYIFKLKDIKNK